ncbi:MAG: RcpC/CpaB family pilus assembly protein [Oscillospiraceae bacterium]
MKLFKNKLFLGIFCIVIALITTFLLGPIAEIFTSRNITVIRAKQSIALGDILQKEMFEEVEVGKYNLPQDVIYAAKDCINKYATVNIQPGDYITLSKCSDDVPSEFRYLTDLPEGKLAISVELTSSATALSGKLRAGDIVSLFAAPPQGNLEKSDDTPATVTDIYDETLSLAYALAPEEIKYVKVLAVTNEVENDISEQAAPSPSPNDTAKTEEEQKTAIQTVILEVNYQQASLLAGLNNNNTLHCALISRGNQEKADELLAIQTQYFIDLEKKKEEQAAQPTPPPVVEETETEEGNEEDA